MKKSADLRTQLIDLLAKHNTGIHELARRTGMSPANISRKLSGDRPLKIEEAELIAAAIQHRVTLTPHR